jgi:16S rRNA (adenine1518-N6/adenine1519-N6)-dimethyltransferase
MAKSVIAIEVDPKLIAPLQQVIAPYQNITLIQGDILILPTEKFIPSSEYLVVANIPYYITSAIIRRLLSTGNRPNRMILTIQYEVAKRICATPGDLSMLALSVQVFGAPKLKSRIPAGAFYPTPKVDSAIISIDLFPVPIIPNAILDAFFFLAQAGFSQKRKTLRNALAGGLHIKPDNIEEILLQAGINPQRRAETLNLAEWCNLTQLFDDRLPEIFRRNVSFNSHPPEQANS